MKKSLVALAAMAFAGVAAAQSSVTLYGVADVWMGKTDAAGDKVQVGNGGVGGSRWGIKGAEDLGGGLKANFNFEQGVKLTTGEAAGFTRQANVGFSGGFGTVKIGKSWNAMDDVFGAANSGFDSKLSANAVWKNSYVGTADAQIHYQTPSFNGFAAAVSTQLNGNSNNGNSRISALNLTYAQGPLAVALGYEENKAPVGTPPDVIPAQKGTMLNGSYDLGKAKLLASYYTTKPIGGGARINSYQLGADIPVTGALTASVGYASSKESGTSGTSHALSLVGAYALSKRTTAYAGIRNANQTGKDLWAVGVNHKF